MSTVGARAGTSASPTPPAAVHPWRAHHPIIAFLVRRIAAGIATLLILSLLIFLATNALPGNVTNAVLGRTATPARVALLDHQLHLGQPVLERYVNWLGGTVRGDFGYSAAELAQGGIRAPVGPLVGPALRNSLILGGVAALLLIPLSLLAGTLAGLKAGRALDGAISYTALLLSSMPEFVLGTIGILVFFTELHLLPPVALVSPGSSPLSHPDHLVLPVLTLVGTAIAFSLRQVRAGVVQAMAQDYVTLARLGGLKEHRVVWRYALRNALAPSVQAFGQTVQYLFGGIIIVEAVFNYPGIGQFLVTAVQLRDVTEVQASALLLAVIYITINIITDLVVVLLVPKLRTSSQ